MKKGTKIFLITLISVLAILAIFTGKTYATTEENAIWKLEQKGKETMFLDDTEMAATINTIDKTIETQITLLKNTVNTSTEVTDFKDITLDLNGNELSIGDMDANWALEIKDCEKALIKDSSLEQTGKIIGNPSNITNDIDLIIVKNSELTINGGTYTCKWDNSKGSGNAFVGSLIYNTEDSKLTIIDGNFTLKCEDVAPCNNNLLIYNDGEALINGGTIDFQGEEMTGIFGHGKLIVNDVNIKGDSTKQYGDIENAGNITGIGSENADITINDATIILNSNSVAVGISLIGERANIINNANIEVSGVFTRGIENYGLDLTVNNVKIRANGSLANGIMYFGETGKITINNCDVIAELYGIVMDCTNELVTNTMAVDFKGGAIEGKEAAHGGWYSDYSQGFSLEEANINTFNIDTYKYKEDFDNVRVEDLATKMYYKSAHNINIVGGQVNLKVAFEGETIKAIPEEKEGYEFTGWLITGETVDTDLTKKELEFTMVDSDITVTAEYKEIDKLDETPKTGGNSYLLVAFSTMAISVGTIIINKKSKK